MDVGRALFYSSSYCGNVGNNDMMGKRMWNSVTAAKPIGGSEKNRLHWQSRWPIFRWLLIYINE
jgi:hypothetical protein